MVASRLRKASTIVVAAVMAISALGLVSAFGISPAHLPSSHIAPGTAAPAASAVPATSTATLAPSSSTTGHDAASAMANAAMAATKAAGLKPNVVFPPRPSATPQQVASARADGVVAPLYSASPAPMGLAYYGLSANPDGSIDGRVLNTTGLQAIVSMNDSGVMASDLYQSSPDSYGIQLNAVVTNITLFGTPGYSFWTQNVVEFYPTAGFLVLITNVWNFSGGPLSENVFFDHGPYGTQVGTTYYYSEIVLPFPISYPFNLTLNLTSTITSGRDAVYFSVSLDGPSIPLWLNPAIYDYDYVVFNSIGSGGPPVTVPSNYTADGLNYNAVGLTNDFELIFGGPGGGSQATLFSANANLSLAYWDADEASFVAVPAAYSYGGETGETCTGADIAWSDAPGGPGGVSTWGTMTTGPSILTGLWNASAPEGSVAVTFNVWPQNAFVLIAPNVSSTWPGWPYMNFTVSQTSVFPEEYTNTTYLVPGNYSVVVELSGYHAVVGSGYLPAGMPPLTLWINLSESYYPHVYTPLWAFNNSEAASLANPWIPGMDGTPAHPYVMVNNQTAPIDPVFGLYNDWGFPVYPAVFFVNTNVSIEFLNPPSFNTSTNTTMFPGMYLPAWNDLQYWFWNVSNVAIVNATNISGWFGVNAYYPVVFDTFSVIFYEGGHNLVAGNNFGEESQGLLMYSGGTFFGPLNVGGGNNTVWGNTFVQVPGPSAGYPLMPPEDGLAMEIAESNDAIYNNYVATPTTAWLLPLNLYSGTPEYFSDAFNIASQPASNVHYASGFPLEPLTGSIIGTPYQGGNYWWDYATGMNPYNGANNPYNLLPYDENASTILVYIYGPSYYYATYIYPGGDFVPLISTSVVTFSQTGLPWGDIWYVNITGGSLGGSISLSAPGSDASMMIALPNGSYTFLVTTNDHRYAVAPYTTTFLVAGAPVSTTPLVFTEVTYLATFAETGLPVGTLWWVNITGQPPESSTGTSIGIPLANGTYSYSVSTANKVYSLGGGGGSGSIGISGAPVFVPLAFSPVTFAVTFTETGLPAGTQWWVNLSNGHSGTSITSTVVLHETNGSYTYVATAADHRYSDPGAFVVSGAPVTVPLTFSPVLFGVMFSAYGLPAGTLWWVNISGQPALSSITNGILTGLMNGSYTYTVGSSNKQFSASGGSFAVSGRPQTLPVHFSLVTYSLVFSATGLPYGKSWMVMVDGVMVRSGSSTISFPVANGSHTYLIVGPSGRQVTNVAPLWTVTILGASLTLHVIFVKGPTYTVTFKESGMAVGQSWCVSLAGWNACSARTSQKFANLTPASYPYTVAHMTGQTITATVAGSPVPLSGTLAVSHSLTVVLKYVYPYLVTFAETGLPAGTAWSVTIKGVTHSSTSSTITFSEPNGTYGFNIGAEPGYTHTQNPLKAIVSGGPVSVTVAFRSVSGHAPALHIGGTEVRRDA